LGSTSNTSVNYNYDNSGPDLIDGNTYYWNVGTSLDDASSWHDVIRFVYSSDPDNPVASNPHIYLYHDFNNSNNEMYTLDVSVNILDPQGPGDISTVTMQDPDNTVYTLFDDGQHADNGSGDGTYGLSIQFNNQAPAIGDYDFTVTDGSGNTGSATDVLDNIIGSLSNLSPAIIRL